MNTEHLIEITGADLVEAVKAAYELSQPQGMGYLHYEEGSLTDEEARAFIGKGGVSLDYVKGRACKFKVFLDRGRMFIPSKWFDHSDHDLKLLLRRIGVNPDQQGGAA